MENPTHSLYELDTRYLPFPSFSNWVAGINLDTAYFDRFKNAIRSKANPPDAALSRAYEIAKRAAALDTGAIEGLYEVDRGFTFTVAFETTAWDLGIAQRGRNVRPLFEAQLKAYDFVLDFATKAEPVSEAAIRKLHEVVCDAQDTYRVATAIGFQEHQLQKGRYKDLPNHVIRSRQGPPHSYAPVDVTSVEMARFVNEMRTEEFLEAHPAIQAAYAHYALVAVHPFADGNGRVARALASAFTYRSVCAPIMILSDYKSEYLDSLEAADAGQYRIFNQFILDRICDTLALIEESMRVADLPSPEQTILEIDDLAIPKTKAPALTDRQVEEAGLRLLTAVESEIRNELARLTIRKFAAEVSVETGVKIGYTPTHRACSNGGKCLRIEMSSYGYDREHDRHLPSGSLYRYYDLLIPQFGDGAHEVQLRREDGRDIFEARLDELFPGICGVLQLRIAIFARRLVSEGLIQFKERISQMHGSA